MNQAPSSLLAASSAGCTEPSGTNDEASESPPAGATVLAAAAAGLASVGDLARGAAAFESSQDRNERQPGLQ